MNSTKRHLLSLTMILLVFAAYAQPGWNWGDSVDKAKEKYALFSDMVRAEQWESAVKPHSWLLKNTPDLNVAIYINGAKIFEGLAENTKDEAKTLEHQAKALEMYDLRIKHFGDEADVTNRKAYVAYKYYRDDKHKYKELYDLFGKAFELNGENVLINNLTAYMDVIRRHKLTGGDVPDDVVFEKYTQIVDIIDAKIAAGGNKSSLEKQRDYVDKLLLATIDVDCDFIEEKLGPKFRQTGEINLAKKIFGLMLQQKCTDSPLAMETAIAVNEVEPSYGIAKFIASKAASEGDYPKALEYYQKAIDLADENEKKAEIYLNMARVQGSIGAKADARSSARKALAFDPSNKDPYTLIGDLYMNSAKECAGNVSRVEDRGVYLAAYKMYKLSGDSERMANAKAQFPGIEEIFNEGKQEGQTFTVGCWINETVVIERRPN